MEERFLVRKMEPTREEAKEPLLLGKENFHPKAASPGGGSDLAAV